MCCISASCSHTAGRQLLTKERPNLAASKSPAWGYLRDSSCWLLTLGKSLTVNAAEQSALLNQLQAEGVHLAGYLPTVAEGGAAWLLVVPDATDLPAAVHGYAEQVYMVRFVDTGSCKIDVVPTTSVAVLAEWPADIQASVKEMVSSLLLSMTAEAICAILDKPRKIRWVTCCCAGTAECRAQSLPRAAASASAGKQAASHCGCCTQAPEGC